MKIEIRGKNIELTDSLKEYVEKRLSKLERYIDDLRIAQVTLSLEHDLRKVEVTIPLNGLILRGEEATEDMYSAIDLVEEKLEKQIEKYRTRILKKYRTSGLKKAMSPEVVEMEDELEPQINGQVVKTKRFAIKPMDTEEAIMQMSLLGHSFFVFFNAESEEVNVVYRRKDGNYGLIEPEF